MFGHVKLQSPESKYQSQILDSKDRKSSGIIQQQKESLKLLQSESPELNQPEAEKPMTSKSKKQSVVFKEKEMTENVDLKAPESLLYSQE